MKVTIMNGGPAGSALDCKLGELASALVKNALDRIIPLIHPYLESVDNEAHHMKRYDSYPAWGLLLEKEEDTDQEDKSIIREIFGRATINQRSTMKFISTTETPLEEVVHAIDNN
jgi:hypothetical protein